MNFAKFLRTPFFTEHLRWLLLDHELSSKIKTLRSDCKLRGGSRTAAASKMELHLGCCSSPRSASETFMQYS